MREHRVALEHHATAGIRLAGQGLAVEQDFAATGAFLAEQQAQGFAALVNTQAATLAIASQVLEPAHYYHRLHQKSAAGIYHQDAPLNQLVDYLSAEHPQLRRFAKTVQQWLEQPEPEQAAELKQQLQHWQNAADSLVTKQSATMRGGTPQMVVFFTVSHY